MLGWGERKRLGMPRKRYPSVAVCEDDGIREGLNPSYGLRRSGGGRGGDGGGMNAGPCGGKLNSWHHCRGKCDTRSTIKRLRRSKLAYSSTRWSIAPRRGSNQVSLSSKCFRESRFTWNAASLRGKTGEAIT